MASAESLVCKDFNKHIGRIQQEQLNWWIVDTRHECLILICGLQVKSIRRTYQKLFMNSDSEAGGLEDRLADLV